MIIAWLGILTDLVNTRHRGESLKLTLGCHTWRHDRGVLLVQGTPVGMVIHIMAVDIHIIINLLPPLVLVNHPSRVGRWRQSPILQLVLPVHLQHLEIIVTDAAKVTSTKVPIGTGCRSQTREQAEIALNYFLARGIRASVDNLLDLHSLHPQFLILLLEQQLIVLYLQILLLVVLLEHLFLHLEHLLILVGPLGLVLGLFLEFLEQISDLLINCTRVTLEVTLTPLDNRTCIPVAQTAILFIYHRICSILQLANVIRRLLHLILLLQRSNLRLHLPHLHLKINHMLLLSDFPPLLVPNSQQIGLIAFF